MDNKNNTRVWIQAFATVLTNIHISNFFKKTIYKGKLKHVCVPGLNCYSCPGATASCPIGAFQSVVGSSRFNFSYYIVGMMILFGVLLGRFICGFLCPFGWFQELIHKIPSKKYSTHKFAFLKKLKYIILVVFVIILPTIIVNVVGIGKPFFCQYICPAGVLEGAIPLALADPEIRLSLGGLFILKSSILIAVVILSVYFYRPFCKWFCPLGAFYSLFNKVSIYQYTLDHSKCTNCGVCKSVCKMDVDITKNINDKECIRCGDCKHHCPQNAIQTSSILITQKKIGGTKDEE